MNNVNRKYILATIVIVVGVIFSIRLFYLQVIDDRWKIKAANITERKITVYPSRGLIYDRNGELLVANTAVYDLMVVPKDVDITDTADFCELVGITREEFRVKMEKAVSPPHSPYTASIFEKQVPGDEFAPIAQKLYKYKGFYGQSRTLRTYPDSIAAHVLGYVSEVSRKTVNQEPYYQPGDYIGASGIEKTYEKHLRGEKGVRYVVVDVFNNEKGPYKGGAYDTLARPAKDLVTTLDAGLQEYGERLMEGKVGSIVALEPSTGEVLALLSSPAYDPNQLVGRVRSENYSRLQKDSLKPLFNRALLSLYPPGSIFKIVQSLVGQQEGILKPSTTFYCDGSVIGDHVSPGYYNLFQGIKRSSNMYFYKAFKRMIQQGIADNIFSDSRIGLRKWKEHVQTFGLGKELDLDIGNLKSGNIPGPEYYDRIYGKGRWAFSTIYSLSIGQGELALIPLQMANLASIIANRGYYHDPHVVKRIGREGDKPDQYKVRHYTSIDSSYFELPIRAMQAVVEEPGGTARRARIDGVAICGKTGTVENPHGEDHSVFMAFAPREDPKIAIAVYVENAGFGGTWAAPISRLMIEKYLKDTISEPRVEQRILDQNFISDQKER